jgi:hypothetical protein
MPSLMRGFLVWILIAVAETLHGVMRNLFLKPHVGDLASRQIGVFTGSALILGITWLLIRWVGARSREKRLALGGMWLVLMLSFEVGLGRAFGMSWERILSDYDPRRGGFMIFGMTVVFLAPLVVAKLRSRN